MENTTSRRLIGRLKLIKDSIKATIHEVGASGEDVAFYHIRVDVIPGAGELIYLWNYIDNATGIATTPPHRRRFEVINIVHSISDVHWAQARFDETYHWITIYVRESDSHLFGTDPELPLE